MEKSKLKIVFLGTPEFALPSLKMLHDRHFNVVAVFTQPDRQTGRGHKVLPPPVAVLAEAFSIPVYQFERVRSAEGVAAIKNIAPDLFVMVAYGQILTQEILDIPKCGCINVHASLLPRLRGAAPIQWAIINGEKQTGVTTIMTTLALDEGDMLERDAFDIPDDMTAGELSAALSQLGAQTLQRTLDKLLAGDLSRTPQNGKDATYFPMFQKGFGQIDFNQPCNKIKDFVRGTNPVPGAYILFGEEKIKVFRATCGPKFTEQRPGEVLFADEKNGFGICAADGIIIIEELQWPGKGKTMARELLRGRSIPKGIVFRSRE